MATVMGISDTIVMTPKTAPEGQRSEPSGRRHARASVVIPAHNEGERIHRCLTAVTSGVDRADYDIVVVCNGCTDDTADQARAFSSDIRVIELGEGNKAGALEAGRQAAVCDTVLYIDADTTVSPGAIEQIAVLLESPDVHGAAPRIRLTVPDDASWGIRRYVDIWSHAPYFRRNLIGAGFFGLDAEAHRRIGPWPRLIADDLVALCHLDPSERATDDNAWFSHEMPRTLRALWRAEIRREAGRREFGEWAATQSVQMAEEEPGGRWLRGVAAQPRHWLGLVIYVGLKSSARAMASRQHRKGAVHWGHPR